jgi:hypothetical protein
MRVPDAIKKCVAFIGYEMADGSFRFAGSVLFLEDHPGKYGCMITARHVIDGIRDLAYAHVWLRLNNKSGACEWIRTDACNWKSPEDASLDIAVHSGYLNNDADHMFLHRELVLTPDIARTKNIGVGDEIFITGLFANYAGDRRNVPIVRVGNLATFPEERINVRKLGVIDAYLIEAWSIGGLSGSPVFYHSHGSPGSAYRPFASHSLSPIATPERGTHDDAKVEQSFYLMGIVHGHYVKEENALDALRNDIEKLNTGIAIVVPIAKVLEFVDATRAQPGS